MAQPAVSLVLLNDDQHSFWSLELEIRSNWIRSIMAHKQDPTPISLVLVKQPKLKPSTAKFVFIHGISGGTTEELQHTRLYAQEWLYARFLTCRGQTRRYSVHGQGNISLKGFCCWTFFNRKTNPSQGNFATSHWYRACHLMFGEAQLCNSARGLFLRWDTNSGLGAEVSPP